MWREEDIYALKAGSDAAFEKAFNCFHEKLYFYLLKHTQSAETTEELVQVTFMKVWFHRARLSETHEFSAQLFRIAKTSLIDHLRKARHQEAFLSAYSRQQQASENIASGEADTLRHLHVELGKLPPVCRKVFTLSRLHGLSHKEISSLLSISPKTVETHITKALRQLRKALLSLF